MSKSVEWANHAGHRALLRTQRVDRIEGSLEDVLGEEQQAAMAWFCVLAATRPSTASGLRNASTSAVPMSAGCRLP
jgi:hypothetical protein